MATFYPVEIDLEGRKHRGQWALLMGGRVCVRALGYESETADVGRDRPEAVAARTLERIVRADQKKRADWRTHQEREMAKLRRPRRTRRPAARDDDRHP